MVENLDEGSRHSIKEPTERAMPRHTFSPETYTAQLTKTVLTIGGKGRAVIIGRGAHLLFPMERGFRVRVVAPFEIRVQRVAAGAGVERAAAGSAIGETDWQRAQFLQENFHQLDDTALLYDLVIDTSGITLDTAAEFVVREV